MSTQSADAEFHGCAMRAALWVLAIATLVGVVRLKFRVRALEQKIQNLEHPR